MGPESPTEAPLPISVSLLGGFELRRAGALVELPFTTQRVISLLALRNRGIVRPNVAGILWPDFTQPRAAASLRSALWRLRRLPARVVNASATQIRLADDVKVDTRDLERLAAGLARGTLDLASESWSLIRCGDLLPDWEDEWLHEERERLHQVRLHALEALAHFMVQAGRLGEAVEAGMAAVAGEPLRESAHRCLIEAYLAEGNVAEAIRQYGKYRDLMQRELAIDPSPGIQELVSAALRQ